MRPLGAMDPSGYQAGFAVYWASCWIVAGAVVVKIYPGVGHEFMDDHGSEDQTLFLRFLARISGTRYDDAATADARRRIIAFVNEHLRSATP